MLQAEMNRALVADIYQKPVQQRAIETEAKFLNALSRLLCEKSFSQVTVDEIASVAGLTHSAFIRRFGSKKQALYVLYDRYCDVAMRKMDEIARSLDRFNDAGEVCCHMSRELEMIQQRDLPANRAMYEDFLEQLTVNDRTKRIFLECVSLMEKIQERFLPVAERSVSGAFAAAQLLVSINCNYVIKSMPGLPADGDRRHQLIGKLVVEALRF